jgi:hypothetical protein
LLLHLSAVGHDRCFGHAATVQVRPIATPSLSYVLVSFFHFFKEGKNMKITAAKKPTKATAKKETSRYINYIPKEIPTGKILCHNGVIPQTPDQKPGLNGFRPWLDDKTQSKQYGPCNCGWSGLPHYMPLAWLESERKEYDARKTTHQRVT